MPNETLPPTRNITINFVSGMEAPALVLTPAEGEKAGYDVHSTKEGTAVAGYRVYSGRRTLLIPLANVLFIEVIL